MAISTATVETLTAEVRVLTVGSRQVTLSVYRQLDWKPFTDIEPFGRVRDKQSNGTAIEVVGKSADGCLIRSSIAPPDWFHRATPEFEHWIHHIKPYAGSPTQHRMLGTRLHWQVQDTGHCPIWPYRRDLPANDSDITKCADLHPDENDEIYAWIAGYLRDDMDIHKDTVENKSYLKTWFTPVGGGPKIRIVIPASSVNGMEKPSQFTKIVLAGWAVSTSVPFGFQVERIVPPAETVAYLNDWLKAEYRYQVETGVFCDMDGLKQTWIEQATEQASDLAEHQSLYDRAKALPLIVLAGLR